MLPTSTVRLSGSSGANPFALRVFRDHRVWGPAHGGANEAALKMLEKIGDVSQVAEYVQGVKIKISPDGVLAIGCTKHGPPRGG